MAMRTVLSGAALGTFFLAMFFVWSRSETYDIQGSGLASLQATRAENIAGVSPPAAAEASPRDREKQLPLGNPPVVVKAVYATAWTAGSENIRRLIRLIDETELNGVVLDIKDYSGFVSYETGIPEVRSAGAEDDIRIRFPNNLIKELHDRGIYVIGRVSVFQDPVLSTARPEWALREKESGKLWRDNKGLSWLDSSKREVWDYNLAIMKDALSRGFDEINLDYIRFASDGNLETIVYPEWDETTPKSAVIKGFFQYIRENLPGAKISADLFGLSTVNIGDLGIGQVIESAYEYFDFVSPMVYPSHYASGFLGYTNPARYPYEVVKYSLESALSRRITKSTLHIASSTGSDPFAPSDAPLAKLRPWLQDFDLGAEYDAPMVKKQIDAVVDALAHGTGTEAYAGWLLWDPTNRYTKEALESE